MNGDVQYILWTASHAQIGNNDNGQDRIKYENNFTCPEWIWPSASQAAAFPKLCDKWLLKIKGHNVWCVVCHSSENSWKITLSSLPVLGHAWSSSLNPNHSVASCFGQRCSFILQLLLKKGHLKSISKQSGVGEENAHQQFNSTLWLLQDFPLFCPL